MNSLQSFLAVAPVKPAAAAAGERLPSSRRARVSACLATPAPPPTAATGAAARRELSAASRAVVEDEARYIVGTYKRAQVVFVAGRGCKLYDIDGREYLDMAAGIAVNALGHCDPDLVDATTAQSKRLNHASNVGYTVPQVELAKRLMESSFADRVFFANSGTEANEAAIKFSRKYQRVAHPDGDAPTEFVSFSNCFHGRTMGALALTRKVQYRESSTTPPHPLRPCLAALDGGEGDEEAGGGEPVATRRPTPAASQLRWRFFFKFF